MDQREANRTVSGPRLRRRYRSESSAELMQHTERTKDGISFPSPVGVRLEAKLSSVSDDAKRRKAHESSLSHHRSLSVPMDAPPPYSDGQSISHSTRDLPVNLLSGTTSGRSISATSSSGSEPHFALARSGPLFTSIRELVDLREKVMTRRIGLEIQENNYNAQWKHTSNHLDNFISTASAFVSVATDSARSDAVRTVLDTWQRLQQSMTYLQKWQAEGKQYQQDLTKWESVLSVKEENVYQQFKHMIAAPEPSSSLGGGSEPALDYDPFTESSIESDPLEHDYYDKIGDLRLIREQIYNSDADQKRRTYEKEFAMTSGEYIPMIRERHSYEDYIVSRQKLVQDYLATKQEMEDLRQQCLERGFDVETPDLDPILDLSQAIERPPILGTLKISNKWNPDAYLMFGGLDKRNRIILWRDNVLKAESQTRNQNVSKALEKHLQECTMSDKEDGPYQQLRSTLPTAEVSPGVVSGPTAADDDEAENSAFGYDDLQERNPTTRRYSEPDTSKRRRMIFTMKSLMDYTVAKSEGGGGGVKIPLPRDPRLWF